MSNAGPARTRPTPRPSATSRPARRDAEWQPLAIFGAGLALGLALGAGVALLTAPQDGEETRTQIRRLASRKRRALGKRSRTAWHDLQDELRGMRQALRKRKLRREVERELKEELATDAREKVAEEREKIAEALGGSPA